jgi:5-methylthioadenosine/S-adenosylhomocysteine deaminase
VAGAAARDIEGRSVTDSVLVVAGGTVMTLDERRTVHHGGSVVVSGNRIERVLDPDEARSTPSPPGAEVIDAAGKVVLPGLVDLHCHTAIERGGHTESLDLERALNDFWYPVMRSLDPDTVYRCARYMYAEQLRSGTTTVNDMFRQLDACAAAAADVGIRACLSGLVATEEHGLDSLADNVEAHERLEGGAGGRVSVRLGIEWLPLSSPELLRETRDLIDRLGTGLHIHLSESLGEVEYAERTFGRRPVAVAEEYGLLGPHCVAAHCVWLTDEEIGVLRDTGTYVSHNPTANAKMGEGIARARDLLDAGVVVGLGHDSTEGNNTNDLFEVMRAAAYLQRASRVDPGALSADEALTMATRNGARALGLQAGALVPGALADLVVVDARTDFYDPEWEPYRRNLPARLVFATNGSRVDTTVVDGRIVVRDGRLVTADADEIASEARDAVRTLMRRLGIAGEPAATPAGD